MNILWFCYIFQCSCVCVFVCVVVSSPVFVCVCVWMYSNLHSLLAAVLILAG